MCIRVIHAPFVPRIEYGAGPGHFRAGERPPGIPCDLTTLVRVPLRCAKGTVIPNRASLDSGFRRNDDIHLDSRLRGNNGKVRGSDGTPFNSPFEKGGGMSITPPENRRRLRFRARGPHSRGPSVLGFLIAS